MDDANLNHLAISLGNVSCKLIEKYGVRKIGDPADAKNRKIARGALAAIGLGLGVYGTTKQGKKIPDPVAYAMTAIGSSNVAELALGPENVLGLTGKMFYEETTVTMPDITRLRTKVGQLTEVANSLKSENAQLRAKIGAMFPEETIKLSPSSTSAGQIGSAADMMRETGTLM